jgi:hypothetical protein
MNKFKTKAGRVTRYALACGYIEEVTLGAIRLQLWNEGGPMLHVRAHDFAEHKRIFWDSFDTLTAARQCFDNFKKATQ